MAFMDFMMTEDTTLRFLHVLSGIVWIGMLYFFNLVNLPLLKFQLNKPFAAKMDDKASMHVISKTLFWFRWGAASTVLFGLLLLGNAMQLYKDAAATKGHSVLQFYFMDRYLQGYAILMGILLALVMAFNVWFIIWPRQQKILGNNKRIAEPTITEEEKAKLTGENAPLAKTATRASRTNTWLSIPMLWGMLFGAHGHAGTTLRDWAFPVVLLVVVLAFAWSYSSQKPAAK
jgi:uncharacterized membrane protein